MMVKGKPTQSPSQDTQYRQFDSSIRRVPFRWRLAFSIRTRVTALKHRLPFRRSHKRPETPDLTTGLLGAESRRTPTNPPLDLDAGYLGNEDDGSESSTSQVRRSIWELPTFGLGINLFNAPGVSRLPDPLFGQDARLWATDDEWIDISTPEAVVSTTDQSLERPEAPTPRRMALHVLDHSLLGDSLADLSDARYIQVFLAQTLQAVSLHPFLATKPEHLTSMFMPQILTHYF